MFRSRHALSVLLPLAGAAPLTAQNLQADATQAQPAAPQASVQWGDFDGDGLVDALTITPERSLVLMRNSGDGGFEDITASSRLGSVAGAAFTLWRDYDGDGQLDLFVGTEAGPSQLLRNAGGTYVDVTAQVGIDASGTDHSAHWVDYDGDGKLDLYLASGASSTFFHALPGGTFERVNLPSMLTPAGQSSMLVSPVVQTTPAADETPAVSQEAQAARATGRYPVPADRTGAGTFGLGAGSAGDLDGQGAGGGTHTMTGTTFQPLCARSLWDAKNAICIEASATATLGMLYPLSNELFVDGGTGNVGMGTTSPTRSLHIKSASSTPLLLEAPIGSGLEMSNIGSSTSWVIAQAADDSLAFLDSASATTRMSIAGGTGNVVVDASLEVGEIITPADSLRVQGMVRAGSETGTDQGPDTAFTYQGVITRRIATTNTASGSVVARAQFLRLTRNGTNGTFDLEWDTAVLNDQVAYGTGLTSTGGIVPIVINLGAPTSAGSQTLFTDSDVVRLDLAFGTTFNIREMTKVTLIRSAGDFWWQGELSSTVNQ